MASAFVKICALLLQVCLSLLNYCSYSCKFIVQKPCTEFACTFYILQCKTLVCANYNCHKKKSVLQRKVNIVVKKYFVLLDSVLKQKWSSACNTVTVLSVY